MEHSMTNLRTGKVSVQCINAPTSLIPGRDFGVRCSECDAEGVSIRAR
jgi:hypothetical protein